MSSALLHMKGGSSAAFPSVRPISRANCAAHAARRAHVRRCPATAAAAPAASASPAAALAPGPRGAPRRRAAHRPCAAASTAAAPGAPLPPEADVVVIGAGLAGLHCAALLQERLPGGGAAAAASSAVLLEASDGAGGRVRTDSSDGFLLDRGFQIFLTGYPYTKEVLNFDALELKPFYAGARVRYGGAFHTVADPLRHFVDGLMSLTNPIGSVGDKVNVGIFRLKSLIGSLEDVFRRPETTTEERLKAEGFSDEIIDRFFRPFLGGIFFDTRLRTSSRLFTFVMRMLATGQNCLPAGGIGAMSEQLAARLAPGSLFLGAKVESIERGGGSGPPARVVLSDGRSIVAKKAVVVATEGPEARRLLGEKLQASPSKSEDGVGTCCLYFAAPAPPSPDNVLYLNGTGAGLVNNACFPSTVSPSYAPAGQTLVSASVIGTRPDLTDDALAAAVTSELSEWFGAGQVSQWRHLRTYRIPFAQPNQAPPTDFSRSVALGDGLFVCGDHRDGATFEGALVSGRRAADAVLGA